MLSRCTEEHTRLTLHRVTVGLALCEFAHTVERGGGDVVERFFGEEGLVRGEHHIRRTEQTRKNIVLNHVVAAVFVEVFLLFFVNVETSRTDVVRAKSFDEVFRVDELTTPRVDDHHALLHLSDALRIHDVLGLRREWAV